MLNRDRQSLREWREEQEREERLAVEERERPIREAVEALKASHRKLAQVERERLTTVPDPDKFIDDSVVGPTVRMTPSQAAQFNADQARAYRESHPETYWSPALVELLAAYFAKEKIKLVSATMIERLVQRFAGVGLLPERPVEREPDPVQVEQPVIAIEPERHVGIDPLTGIEREYTPREINLMSGDDFRRAFKLTKAAMALPNHSAF